MTLHEDPLIERVLNNCDAIEIIELCDITTEELVEVLRGHILDNRERFLEYMERWDDWA